MLQNTNNPQDEQTNIHSHEIHPSVPSSHKALEEYLESFLVNPENYTFPRVKCCETTTDTGTTSTTTNSAPSRALYCTDCSQLLIPRDQWPISIQNGQLDLPFHLDILLSDRRRSSTGFHALVLYRASKGYNDDDDDDDDDIDLQQHQHEHQKEEKVRLFDLEHGDTLPNYQQQQDGTFVLFPSQTSVPISTVAKNIHRLVVLDCKWTKSSSHQKLSAISSLPHVHLNHPPIESFYWRWHNAGPGMISTLEAIYFAAWEVVVAVAEENENCDKSSSSLSSSCSSSSSSSLLLRLLDWMWLFGIQRAATAQGAMQRGKPLPFSREGKEDQRELRRTEKGSEKHLRDIALGKRLKEQQLKN